MVTDEMVERAAAAMFSHGDEGMWEALSKNRREFWRGYAREALEAALSAAEPVAWRWRSTLFAEWNLSDKPPIDQQSMEQLMGLNMEGLEWQDLYSGFFDGENAREKKLETVVEPDNGTTAEVLSAVLECAEAWVPEARIIGNVRAGDIARVVRSALYAQVQDVAGLPDDYYSDDPAKLKQLLAQRDKWLVDNGHWHDFTLSLPAAPAKQEGGK